MIQTEHSSRRKRKKRRRRNLPTSPATMTELSIKRTRRKRRSPHIVPLITPHLHTTQVTKQDLNINKIKTFLPRVQVQHMEVTFLFQSEPRDTSGPRWWDQATGKYLSQLRRDAELFFSLLQLAPSSALWTFWLQTELSVLRLCDLFA